MKLQEFLKETNTDELDIISYEYEEALEIVKQNGAVLRYVHNQTEEICLEAVKENSFALQYVHNQTEEMCLEAVKQNGFVLQFVKNQTEEICLEAVKQDKDAIIFVDKSIFENDKECDKSTCPDTLIINGVKYVKAE